MAEKVAELRRLPTSAERRQERCGKASGGAGPTAPVPLDSERGLQYVKKWVFQARITHTARFL